MAKDYVPSPHNEFNDFQINLVTRTAANAVAWGIAAGKVTALQAAQTIYQPFYTAIANPNDRSKSKNTDHKAARKVYEAVIRQFVKANLVFNEAITPGEKELLGINPGTEQPTPRPAITTFPYILLKALGGLQVVMECRVESDSTRPSIHPDADGIEFRAIIGTVPPANYNEATIVSFSSKARITDIYEPEQFSKYLYVFARWINLTDEAKSGPWSALASVMIS